jgi:hypothetical protein
MLIHLFHWGELTHKHDSWDDPPVVVNLAALGQRKS